MQMQVHSTVRQRWLDGDKFIISSMQEVARVAEEGRTVLLEKDYSKLAALMNRNFDLRRLVSTYSTNFRPNIRTIYVSQVNFQLLNYK